MVLSHVMRGRPRGLLQSSEGAGGGAAAQPGARHAAQYILHSFRPATQSRPL